MPWLEQKQYLFGNSGFKKPIAAVIDLKMKKVYSSFLTVFIVPHFSATDCGHNKGQTFVDLPQNAGVLSYHVLVAWLSLEPMVSYVIIPGSQLFRLP